jgi:hypothetical protein
VVAVLGYRSRSCSSSHARGCAGAAAGAVGGSFGDVTVLTRCAVEVNRGKICLRQCDWL